VAVEDCLSWESQTEGVQRWHPGGVWTHNTPGPMHRSCALYATVGVCPYLRHSNTRGKVSAGRGEAAVFGFARHGLAFFDGPLGLADPESSSLDHIFGYAEERQRIDSTPTEDTSLCTSRRLLRMSGSTPEPGCTRKPRAKRSTTCVTASWLTIN
jgi:hypothetical protein